MRDVFHGWKRKAGVATLVLACVLMIGWVRTCRFVDWFGIDFYPSSWQLSIVSGDGRILMVLGTPRRIRDINEKELELTIVPREIHEEMPVWDGWVHGAQSPSFFFVTRDYLTVRVFRELDAETPIPMVPYWLMTIPLTLAAAWLLLATQRTPTSNAHSEALTQAAA